jgi:hypothetical protein
VPEPGLTVVAKLSAAHVAPCRSKHENALPLIVTHGWPGSIIEQLKIIGPLTNPTAHGGRSSTASENGKLY